MVGTMGILVALVNRQIGQGSSKSDIFCETLNVPFLCHTQKYCKLDVTKVLVEKLGDILFPDTIYCCNQILFISESADFDNLNLKRLKFVLGPIW